MLPVLPMVVPEARAVEISSADVNAENDPMVTVGDVALAADTVTGTLVNRSDEEVRDVRLLVDLAFLWRDEFHPGEDNPGRSFVVTVPGPIPPHGSTALTVRPNPPPEIRHDGRYATSVHVLGFSHVAMQGAIR